MPHYGEKGYSLDRIDNGVNYEPNNVRWADVKTQNRNKRTNTIIELDGEKMCLKQAAEKSGINYQTLHMRYYHGDRGDELFRPVKK